MGRTFFRVYSSYSHFLLFSIYVYYANSYKNILCNQLDYNIYCGERARINIKIIFCMISYTRLILDLRLFIFHECVG